MADINERGEIMSAKKFSRARIIILAMLFTITAIILPSCEKKMYLGAASPLVKIYELNENGGMINVASVPRGNAVKYTGKKEVVDDSEMSQIRIPEDLADRISGRDENAEADGEDSGSEQLYYVGSDNLVDSRDKIVQETELYVRTPVTIYENEQGPEIASYMAKGSRMDIVEIGELQEDGTIDKYKVAYTDAAEKSGEGYVYGKYMVGTAKDAEANYNEHGEYKAAKKAEYSFDLGGGHARDLDYYPVKKPSFDGNELCTDARTMYINTEAAINYRKYVKLIKSTDCNAVVIDIKDGPLTYKSEVAKEYSKTSYKKAYASVEEFREGVDAYKDAGVYTIGRIVVFNDSRYAKDHPEDCINKDNWPSAFSRNVWEYNVKLAIEAVELFGFNEIQFDYVRFPESSFEMSQNRKTDWRNRYKEQKAQAIQNFCFYACDQIHEAGAYVSVDVFGECSYSYCTAYGQYWPAISNVVDAISSMPYSDHHGENDTWTHPYKTLNYWAKLTAQRQKECPTPAIDRTWITGYNTPYWNPTVNYNTKIMKQQIKALRDAGLKGGFIPWNVLSDIDKYRQYKDIWNK